MSENDPVDLAGIPVFTGDLALLDTKVTALAKSGEAISTAAGDVHSSFGGLQAFYKAPEADQLFATTKPVADRGHSLKSDLATITGALSTYSDEAHPLVEKLKELKRDAGAFLVKANADDKWREDGDLIDENRHRHDEIIETWTAFQNVERACHNKIVALVGGPLLKVDDGSGKEHTYGYDADALKQAKGLPWGDPVEESKPWWHLHEHALDFAKGFVIDGVVGTVKGLGTLVGTDGWESTKQAWTGLGKLATGLALGNPYMGGALFWSVPEDKLPSWLRDSRAAVKETGKALLAWDQWGENPSRAAGAVTFNVVTTVFTGGTGGAASGTGKAALAAKALSTAGKVGRFVDPMTYVFKGAGMGLTKARDVVAGLRGVGNVEIALPKGAISLPEGAFKLPDGTLHLPEGAAVPEGAFEVPSNSVKLPDGAEIPAGAVDLGDGVVRLPEGMAPPAGSLTLPEGALKLPEGTTALPEGAAKLTDPHGNTVYVDGPGNLLKEDGTLLQHHTAAKPENPATGANTPATHTPSPQPALVGAHSVGSTDGAIRMGDEAGDVGRVGDDLGDAGRVGDDANGANGTPGGAANHLPGGSAGHHMPSNSVDGGGPAGHQPTNNLDGGTPGGSHPEPTGAGGRDAPGGADHAMGGADPANDVTASPAHQADQGSAADNGGIAAERELTAAERKELQDRHVWLANNNDVWRDAHYRSDGHRWNKNIKVDGVELPILKKDANGGWIAKYDLPHGPSEIKHSRTPLKPDSADPRHLPKLDEAAKNSRVSVDLANSEKEFKENPSLQNRSGLETATDAYRDQLADTPNNSKHSERLGEMASRLHAIPKIFPTAKHVDLLRTPNGANMLDDLYELGDDGGYLIVEQKGPKANLNPPRLGAGPAAQMMVKQGTRPYLETIFHEMWRRGGEDRKLADKLFEALESKKLQYVLVKGKESAGSYDGSVLEHFEIY